MPMTARERGSLGGKARTTALTATQRQEAARAAHLAGAAKTIEKRAADLPPEVRSRLIRALQEANESE